jgi:hypothetical protein
LQGDGASLRTHLQRAAETGRIDERLFNECPRDGLSLWTAYVQIARSRPAGFGASGISLQEIEAWQRLYDVRLTAWELDTIIELDAAFLRRASKKKG